VSAGEPDAPILALNSGSSSLKFAMYRVGPSRLQPLLSGEADAIGLPTGSFRAQRVDGSPLASEQTPLPSQREAIARIGRLLGEAGMPAPAAIGHRIVHGGPRQRRHCLIDAAVLADIEAAAALAPLHAPPALAVIAYAREHFPDVPQAACFDTAFHAGLLEAARTLPLPAEFRAEGVERYGFHGLSCESIVRQLGDDLPERLVIAHLGSGASVTAVKHGRSIDTSMGLTPTGGLIMGTRTGDVDPGVLLYLLREKKLDAAALAELVDRRSGLMGISGVSSDMRRLQEAAVSNENARLAIAMFCRAARKQIAGMIAALEGVDALVFTGGIGERDTAVRGEICRRLAWAGLGLDEERNRAGRNPISADGSLCKALVLTTREDDEIARHAYALSQGS
jgi:acetate kinase